ncbi:MAG: ATP-binding protein [Acidobacteria bacterium]|nr:ATP-binding protein [Acidobacteriota bacterium]
MERGRHAIGVDELLGLRNAAVHLGVGIFRVGGVEAENRVPEAGGGVGEGHHSRREYQCRPGGRRTSLRTGRGAGGRRSLTSHSSTHHVQLERRYTLQLSRIFRDNGPVYTLVGTPPPTNALLSFSIRNVRSYWEEATLSLIGTRLSDAEVVRGLQAAGIQGPANVLPTAGLFGANASGKSAFLRAMADMRAVVLSSFRKGDQETKLPRQPFLLHDHGAEQPSRFEIDLILHGVRWQYGFEIDDQSVRDEYAYYYPKGRQALVFRRERDDRTPSFGPAFRSSGRVLARLVRRNALLLSVVGAVADGPVNARSSVTTLIGPLFDWFRDNLRLMAPDNRGAGIAKTAELLPHPKARGAIVPLLQAADLGIKDIERIVIDAEAAEKWQRALRGLDGLEEEPAGAQDEYFLRSNLLRLSHAGTEGAVSVDPEHESQGTLAWVSLLGPLLETIRRGSVLLLDELDSSLHPHLVRRFIRLFHDPKTNPWCAQLVFNAHDPTILGDSSQRTLGRDQIWLTEKNADGGTTLYSLAEFQPKRDEALGKRYLQGRYGAVPVLDPAEFRLLADADGS